MFEEAASAIPSIWASMNSWFTPTVLFVLLNLMIGTIALTSALANKKQNHRQHPAPPKLDRSLSVLQRLKSVNFYGYYFRSHQEPQNLTTPVKKPTDSDALFNLEQTHQPQNPETHSTFFFQQSHQENSQENLEPQNSIYEHTHEENSQESDLKSMDEVYSQLIGGGHFSRTKSDTEPASGEVLAKLPAKMRKSASVKSAFGHFEEEEVVVPKRPATVRERGNAEVTGAEEEVDARADDFINRFKQQLKLQRLDSILRYKEMIGKRAGK